MRPIALALLAFCGGVAGGFVSLGMGRLAQADSSAITVPVPFQGVLFRTPEGRMVARLRSEASGGVFEVFNGQQQVAVRLRATNAGGTVELGRATTFNLPARVGAGSTEDSGY